MVARAKKNFGLIDTNGKEIGIFEGAQPRDAALKVANKGIVDIVLREKGTKIVHYFRGTRTLAAPNKSAPEWIKKAAEKKGGKIHVANVEKIGIGHLEYAELERNPKSLFKVPAKKA